MQYYFHNSEALNEFLAFNTSGVYDKSRKHNVRFLRDVTPCTIKAFVGVWYDDDSTTDELIRIASDESLTKYLSLNRDVTLINEGNQTKVKASPIGVSQSFNSPMEPSKLWRIVEGFEVGALLWFTHLAAREDWLTENKNKVIKNTRSGVVSQYDAERGLVTYVDGNGLANSELWDIIQAPTIRRGDKPTHAERAIEVGASLRFTRLADRVDWLTEHKNYVIKNALSEAISQYDAERGLVTCIDGNGQAHSEVWKVIRHGDKPTHAERAIERPAMLHDVLPLGTKEARAEWLERNPDFSLKCDTSRSIATWVDGRVIIQPGSGKPKGDHWEVIPSRRSSKWPGSPVGFIDTAEPLHPAHVLLDAIKRFDDLSGYTAEPFSWPCTGDELQKWASTFKKRETVTIAGEVCLSPEFGTPPEGGEVFIINPYSLNNLGLVTSEHAEEANGGFGWFHKHDRVHAEKWALQVVRAARGDS